MDTPCLLSLSSLGVSAETILTRRVRSTALPEERPTEATRQERECNIELVEILTSEEESENHFLTRSFEKYY